MDSELLDSVKQEEETKSSLCRLCASCTQLLIPIFEGEGLENNLPEKIDKYLPIQVAPVDVLPLQVCYQCASTVLSWHELTTTCIEAEQKLQSIFGKNENPSSDPPLSPADSRREYEDFYAESVLSPRDQENNDILLSPNENVAKGQSDQVEEVRVEPNICEPPEGDVERFIAEVTEEIGDVVCLEEIHESSKSLNVLETCSSNDHSYSREPLKDSKSNSNSLLHGREQLCQPTLSNSSVKTVFKKEPQPPKKKCRPIMPRPSMITLQLGAKPRLSPVAKASNVKSMSENTSDSLLESSQLYLVCGKSETEQKSLQKPILVPFNTPSPKKKVQLSVQRNSQVNVKSSHQVSAKNSSQPVTRNQLLGKGSPGRCLPAPQIFIPKLRDITVTRVNPRDSRAKPLKKVQKASVTVLRKPLTAFACTICAAQFSHEIMRKRHMFLRHGLKQYNCLLCKNSFGRKDELTSHVRSSHPTSKTLNQPKYPCRVCKETFEKVYELKMHARSKHPVRLSSPQLVIEKAIKQKKIIAGVAITEKEAEWLKDFCKVVDNKEAYYCQVCKRTWSSLEKSVVHIRTHTKEQLYSCDTCGQRFNTRGVLIRHQQVHNNTKPFSCEYCEKAFSSKQNRDDHHRSHTKEVKTVCESCGEFLTSASMLYYHRKIHSGVNPYQCPYCEKAYSIRSLLKRHIRFHTGEKPHLCSVCGRGFKTSSQLRGHSAVHSDARPFSCEGCRSMFKTMKYLSRHRAICSSIQSKVSSKV